VFDQSQMDYVQNMDRDFEADNLGMFIDWNDDQFQPTFLQTDIPLTGLEDANLMEPLNSQTQLPPPPPTVVSTELALIFLTFLFYFINLTIYVATFFRIVMHKGRKGKVEKGKN